MYFLKRIEDEELMDDPGMSKESMSKAYLDINRCNTLLGGTAITIRALEKLIEKRPKKSYTIYDMGCGDGFMLRKIAQSFENKAIDLHLVGIDLRDDILSIAKEKSTEYPMIRYQKGDIMTFTSDQGCDILLCTLTMHHFKEPEIVRFLKKFSELARIGVVINDLERNKMAYHLFKLFSFFFIKSRVAKIDGLISIQKGFRRMDLKRIANGFDTMHHQIHWKWAFRYLWVMQPLQGS